MKIEKTEVWLTPEKSFAMEDSGAIRGFLGNLFRHIPQFHGHIDGDLIYRHPQIQYKVIGGSALIIGLKEGAFLLKALPSFKEVEIRHKKVKIFRQNVQSGFLEFGIADRPIKYVFLSPWFALNEVNFSRYQRISSSNLEVSVFLKKILIGNILSMAKSFRVVVDQTIEIQADIREGNSVKVKENLDLLGFQGSFEANFHIPDFWGVGKFSSKGFGTIRQSEFLENS